MPFLIIFFALKITFVFAGDQSGSASVKVCPSLGHCASNVVSCIPGGNYQSDDTASGNHDNNLAGTWDDNGRSPGIGGGGTLKEIVTEVQRCCDTSQGLTASNVSNPNPCFANPGTGDCITKLYNANNNLPYFSSVLPNGAMPTSFADIQTQCLYCQTTFYQTPFICSDPVAPPPNTELNAVNGADAAAQQILSLISCGDNTGLNNPASLPASTVLNGGGPGGSGSQGSSSTGSASQSALTSTLSPSGTRFSAIGTNPSSFNPLNLATNSNNPNNNAGAPLASSLNQNNNPASSHGGAGGLLSGSSSGLDGLSSSYNSASNPATTSFLDAAASSANFDLKSSILNQSAGSGLKKSGTSNFGANEFGSFQGFSSNGANPNHLAEFSHHTNGEDSLTASLSPDPNDYFTRIDLEQSLFKVIHLRYQSHILDLLK